MDSLRLLFTLIALCCFLFLLTCCEKKKDETTPQILVTSPTDLNAFMVGDSISVVAQISHTSEITSVKVSLVNDAGIPVLVPKYIFPESTSYALDYAYPINENLETGTYNLLVSAGDGSKTAKVYTHVMITGIGRFFEQVIAICIPNTLKTLLYAIDASGNQQNILSLDYGYTDSDISSDLRQLYMIKPSPDILYAYNLDRLTEDYAVIASPPHPEYNSVSYFPSLTYVPNGNGEIRGYDKFGSSAYVTSVNVDTIPMQCWKHDNMVLAYCERRGGPECFIRQYYGGTGVLRAGLKLEFTVVDIFSADSEKCLLIGNDANQGKAYLYDITGNYLAGEIQVPAGMIRQGVQVSANVFLISHENGIYRYNHATGSLTIWLPGVDADALAYDDLRQYVYYAADAKVFLHRYPDADMLQEIVLPYPVLNLHVQYNK